MIRKLLLLFGVYAMSSLSARAQDQDKVEIFGGYSYVRFRSTNLNGWEVAGQYKFLDWLGGVADVDGHYGSFDGIGILTYTFLFGPQISRPSSMSPFGHLLLGGAITAQGVSQLILLNGARGRHRCGPAPRDSLALDSDGLRVDAVRRRLAE